MGLMAREIFWRIEPTNELRRELAGAGVSHPSPRVLAMDVGENSVHWIGLDLWARMADRDRRFVVAETKVIFNQIYLAKESLTSKIIIDFLIS